MDISETVAVEFEWPEDLPPAPSTPPPSSAPPSTDSFVPVLEEDPILWKRLREEEDERVAVVTLEMQRIRVGDLYEHIPDSQVDWGVIGLWECRVFGSDCYGRDFGKRYSLSKHLHSKVHTVTTYKLSLVLNSVVLGGSDTN
ncbi:hypothetical protein EDB81DRAFT_774237 [Dactylonectria macrodidyma]|uniref:Uncharacterized protein n=1 Tax=Dactylonectria macrodidyma TaxID=307937 RepID=A0A9P9FP52_9HYPO|nr:hypothetical protein EDB81DRAFT_774237 [Dactylonectria macrodidyma]